MRHPITLRDERASDADAIRDVTRRAFAQAPHASGNEQDIVDALRTAGALEISLVAEALGRVIGHVAVSRVHLESDAAWFGLGPISVSPEHQRRGVGTILMRGAIARLRDLGADGCVLVGEPEYYARFGFEPAAPLVYPGIPPEYFRALDLRGPRPRGVVRYHPAFGG